MNSAVRRFCLLHLVLVVGCSSAPPPVPVPIIAPKEAAAQAFAAYDTNKDGKLDAKELEKCPALKSALATLDQDKDGSVSSAELEKHLEKYQQSNIGLISTLIQVQLDGKPLEGATVTFVPEEFMGPTIKPASGVTAGNGIAEMKTEGADVPGCNFGFYKVQVSKKDSSGQESIPARYNSQTVLGREVGGDMRGSGDVFRLTSR